MTLNNKSSIAVRKLREASRFETQKSAMTLSYATASMRVMIVHNDTNLPSRTQVISLPSTKTLNYFTVHAGVTVRNDGKLSVTFVLWRAAWSSIK